MPEPAANQVTVFAETNFRNQRRKFGIKVDDRRRHMYLVGKTGMGKSTVLENMFINDIRAGHGVAIVDPHGDLAEKVLHYIPSDRINDVIYFNPSDTHFPLAFNILESIGEDYKHLVAYGLVGVFKKIWADSWGPRMEYILTNTILGLLDYPGSTLLGVMRMLVDKAYRKKVVAKITDPVVKTFWTDEYANYSEKFRSEAIAPIQNKVGQFLSSSIIRNIVGQSKSTIEMRDVMDNRKILIMNLAKGRIGEENSALLGAMMITKLQIAAMSRVDIAEVDRKDFYLYVDEFQNFATDSFAGILSEARKYRLCLIMAHQYLEQLGDEVKAAVFGNVGTLVVFRVGATDALEMEPEFGPQFVAQDLINLKKYTFCIRLMIDGVATEPFSGQGLPPITGETNVEEKVVKVSRERYARPKAMVEEKILRWSGVEMNTTDSASGDDDDTSMDIAVPVSDSKVVLERTEQDKLNEQINKPLAFGSANQLIPEQQNAVASESINIKSELEPAPAVTAPMRPKINFIRQEVTEENPTTTTHVTIEPTVASNEESENDEAIDETEDSDDDFGFASEPETKSQQVAQTTPSPAPQSTIQPDTKTGLSLSALRDGNVSQVQFGGGQPRQSNPSISQTNEQLNHQPGDPNRKKRKRKRNRGGGNAFPNPVIESASKPSQPPTQSPRPTQSQSQVKPQFQPSTSIQQSQPRPAPTPTPMAKSQPVPQPISRSTPQPTHTPVVPAPKLSPTPSSIPDSTKVNMSDLL